MTGQATLVVDQPTSSDTSSHGTTVAVYDTHVEAEAAGARPPGVQVSFHCGTSDRAWAACNSSTRA